MFKPISKTALTDFLEKKVKQYNHPSFIPTDPISVPHRFSKKQDIEIAGLFAAVFAWGNRTTIIRKSNELMKAFDQAPHDFMLNHRPADLKKLVRFKHRTFNSTDLLYFIRFLQSHYQQHDSLETAFLPEATEMTGAAFVSEAGQMVEPYFSKAAPQTPGADLHAATRRDSATHFPAASGEWETATFREVQEISQEAFLLSADGRTERIKNGLSSFYTRFFSLEDAPRRTQKHIATPQKNAACKRLNMYLRWMVRRDGQGVDFGLWRKISPADLVCPVDLHVARVAKKFGLISRTQTDWKTAMELTSALREMDEKDPVKFDFALFGLGVFEKY